MNAGGSAPWMVRAEVERVVADLLHWRRSGILVLAVEPLDGPGVRVGVHGLHPLAARALRVRYRFPAECWEAPTTAVDGADIPVPSVLSELECPAVT